METSHPQQQRALRHPQLQHRVVRHKPQGCLDSWLWPQDWLEWPTLAAPPHPPPEPFTPPHQGWWWWWWPSFSRPASIVGAALGVCAVGVICAVVCITIVENADGGGHLSGAVGLRGDGSESPPDVEWLGPASDSGSGSERGEEETEAVRRHRERQLQRRHKHQARRHHTTSHRVKHSRRQRQGQGQRKHKGERRHKDGDRDKRKDRRDRRRRRAQASLRGVMVERTGSQ